MDKNLSLLILFVVQIMKMSDYIAMHERQRKISKIKRARGIEKQDLPGTHICNKCNKVTYLFANLVMKMDIKIISKSCKILK